MTKGKETKKEKIIAKAIELLESDPNGIRYSELVKKNTERISRVSC